MRMSYLNIIPILIIITICFYPFQVLYGEEKSTTRHLIKPPSFNNLGSTENNGILQMECEGQKPDYKNIDCMFTQLLLMKKSEKELKELRDKRKLEYKEIKEEEIKELKKSFSKKMITKERRELLDSMTPEKRKYSDLMWTYLEKYGKSKTLSESVKIIEDMTEFHEKCCSLIINKWKQKYERISNFKWMSNPGPQGFCNIVRIGTIESKDDSYLLWKYTQITVSVDYDKKSDDVIDQYCSGIEINKPTIYSWDIPTELIIECSCITYYKWF